MSLAHALSLADAIRDKVTHGASNPANLSTSPEEIRATRAMRTKVKKSVDDTITILQNVLKVFDKNTPKASVSSNDQKPLSLKEHRVAQSSARAVSVDDPSNAEKLVDGLSGSNLDAVTGSLNNMTGNIGTVLTTFDNILAQPYLNQFSATLETVPVVGLIGGQISYLKASTDESNNIAYSWASFCSFPPNVTVNSGDNVRFFPYKGDFYLAINQTVWQKVHTPPGDPAVQTAVDNWPALYLQGWTALGDCLPAANLAAVIPFTSLDSDHHTFVFQLITLSQDGVLQWMNSDQLTPNSVWTQLNYDGTPTPKVPPPPKASPNFTKIAYWNGGIVGVDDSSNTWDITVSFITNTYQVANQSPINPVTEFTATEEGLIGLQSDGYLWKRVVAPSPQDPSSPPVAQWLKWTQADNVTNLAVASPGVILDMKTLIASLKSTYIDVQTSIYPVISTLAAFCDVHTQFLSDIWNDAQAFNSAPDGSQQQTIALQAGLASITQARVWVPIVSSSVTACQAAVTNMGLQIPDIKDQLSTLILGLQQKLQALQGMLATEQGEVDKLLIAEYSIIAAIVCSVAITAAGAIFQLWPLIPVGGGLIVAGIVGLIMVVDELASFETALAQTKTQITSTTTSIGDAAAIWLSITELDVDYGDMNVWWGNLSQLAMKIGTDDHAIATEIGFNTLSDTSSIEAAQTATTNMSTACQSYLDILNRQGITPPSSFSVTNITSRFSGTPSPAVHELLRAATGPITGHALGPVIKVARDALTKHDREAYFQVMEHAKLLQMDASVDISVATTTSGLWLDVPKIRGAADVWLSSSQNFVNSSGVLDAHRALGDHSDTALRQANAVDSALDKARPLIISSLEETVNLASTLFDWSKALPVIHTHSDKLSELESYRTKALTSVENAQRAITAGNDYLTTSSALASTYVKELAARAKSLTDSASATNTAFDTTIKSLSPPSYVSAGGAGVVSSWVDKQTRSIKSQRDGTLRTLNEHLSHVSTLKSSGGLLNNRVKAWVKMSQDLQTNLKAIHNILTEVWFSLKEPKPYAAFIQGNWAQLLGDVRDVLAIVKNSAASSITRHKGTPVKQGTGSPSPVQRVVQAVSPALTLGPGILSQTQQATSFFQELDALFRVPGIENVIGYWDANSTRSLTLRDIILSLRSEYANIVALEYDVIQELQTIALVQGHRAHSVVAYKHPIQTFAQPSLVSIRSALKFVDVANNKLKDSSLDFELVLHNIELNIQKVEKKIADLDQSIDEGDKDGRDRITEIVANTIATFFINTVLFGLGGPVSSAIEAAIQQGTTAAAIATNITAVLNTLNLSDVLDVVQSLKATRSSLVDSINALKQAQPLFKKVVKGIADVNAIVEDMYKKLLDVQGVVRTHFEVVLTHDDAEDIAVAWTKIKENTQVWLDAVNKQGIVPGWVSN